MALLSIHVLGPLQVRLSQEPLTGFATDKVRALLIYLVMSPDRPHRREALAGLLWPEFPERSARNNLRNALANLRQVIGDGAASPPFLHCTRQTIQFNGQSDYWLDADAFEDLLTLHPTMSVKLEQTVRLFRGPFLEGFTLADSAAFDEWLLLRRERYGRLIIHALDRLAATHEGHGAFESALTYARRRVEMEPWQEEGQRQLMRLLIRTGRRSEALAVFEAHRQELAAELGVEPAPETIRLFEQIRNGELKLPAPSTASETSLPLPGFLKQERDAVDPPLFVARERELAQLDGRLDDALAGHGQVIFVTGGPGRGKTALLAEFGRRAMGNEPDLLVAAGSCNAFSGIGDPYLPFRDVLAMLTGDVETRWSAGSVSTIQARRLWNALPCTGHALLHHGPLVIGPLVDGQALLSRAALWCAADAGESQSPAWLHRLRRRIEQRQIDPARAEQSHLFQQVTNLLRVLAQAHPLLLILDDLQWADTASISLLFHLGRRLEDARILIAGAYRAEEIALGRPAASATERYSTDSDQIEQHPLQKVLGEFKRNRGDIWLDLARTEKAENRHFVDALLETEPNHLGEGFRKELARRAGGHPLFTIELVRAMQARGDLIRDSEGFWIEEPMLDWETLPVRVQGAIEARIGRLEPELREILNVASVEGENMTVQVMAQVQGIEEGVLLRRLAQDLARRHKLVVEQAEVRTGPRRLSRFKFNHALIQNYLYQQLSRAERRLLHGKVAAALESCYGDQAGEFAVQLAHHYSEAGSDGRALHYFTRAAQNAQSMYANDEAYAHYTRAIEAARKVSANAETIVRLHLERGQVCQTLGDFAGALADYEGAFQLVGNTGGDDSEFLAWRALINMGRLWASRDYNRAYDCFTDALELAHQIGDPKVLAESLNWMGNWHNNQENPPAAAEHHRKALEIFEEVGDQRDLAVTLDLLGITTLLGSDLISSTRYYDRAVKLFRELDDQSHLGSSLTGRGHARGYSYNALTTVVPVIPVNPQREFEEAMRIARETGSLADEAWLGWSMSRMYLVYGRYGQALEAAQRGLDIAIHIGHREWIVGGRSALGALFLELLAPEPAQRELDVALNLAKELRSQFWIHWVTAKLAGVCCLSADWAQAEILLEPLVSSDTPMDGEARRYCWAMRAELALCQGDPLLALDIVERLIASAPGIAPGRVISYLWKLKGEALAAIGDTQAACSLLHAAIVDARSRKERFLLWRLHASLGQLYHVMGRQLEAEEERSIARELLKELADSMPDGDLKDNFLQRAQESLE